MTLNAINEELKIQIPALNWLKEHWGYQEIKSAEEDDAWGAPIDSVGLMDGRTLLVEVKVTISSGDVRHNPNRSSSIEGKLSRTLNGLFDGSTAYNLPAIRQTWDRAHPLIFVVLAQTYTPGGLNEAKEVLQRRSSEWSFEYRIWQWTGAEVRELTGPQPHTTPCPDRYDRLQIPLLCGTSNRRATPSIEAHRQEGGRRGLLVIFDCAIKLARQLGYQINRTAGGITLVAARQDRKRESSIGIFVTKSSKHTGMNFGFTSERGDIKWDQLPGRSAPKVGVYSGPYRYIRTTDEVEIALRMFAPSP
jgi:hypothetical protein